MALMRRQSLVKFDAPLCETIVDTPKPQGREVLVRIERCGLCHSDLHIQDGTPISAAASGSTPRAA
jgi:Zn-dependent alcohol dehydrogenases